MCGVGHGLDHQDVAQPVEDVSGETTRLVPGLNHAVDDVEESARIAFGDSVHHLGKHAGIGDPHQLHGVFVGDACRSRACHELAKQRQRIAHTALGGTGHEGQGGGVRSDFLLLTDPRQVVAQHSHGQQPEGVVVCAGADRAEDLLRLSGGEDETQMCGRLLNELEQRVPRILGQLVSLVDDVHRVAAIDGGELGVLAQFPGVLHTSVSCRVDLHHVDGPGTVRRQVAARLTLTAGVGGGTLHAVEAAREDPRTRGLPATAWSREQIGVMHTVVLQRANQWAGDVFLPHDVLKPAGAVLAIQGQRHRPSVTVGSRRCRGAYPQANGGRIRAVGQTDATPTGP